MAALATEIACSDATSVTIRGKSLVDDLIGKRTFTEMVYFLTCGREPGAAETRVLDACLVTLMEHGFTPRGAGQPHHRGFGAGPGAGRDGRRAADDRQRVRRHDGGLCGIAGGWHRQ